MDFLVFLPLYCRRSWELLNVHEPDFKSCHIGIKYSLQKMLFPSKYYMNILIIEVSKK